MSMKELLRVALNAKDIRDAQVYANRAQTKFALGSRGWLIAEDIITYKIPA